MFSFIDFVEIIVPNITPYSDGLRKQVSLSKSWGYRKRWQKDN